MALKRPAKLAPATGPGGGLVFDIVRSKQKARRSTRFYVEKKLRPQIGTGDGVALLLAIDYCARSGMAMPEWLAQAFTERYDNWRKFRVKTLDAAFGVRRGRRIRIERQRAREELKPYVVYWVRLLQQKGAAIDDALFERVGKRLKISGPSVKRIYYDPDNPWRDSPWSDLLS
jgi:hypothetical protein